MKKTVLWGALFALTCAQVHADAAVQPTQQPTTAATPSSAVTPAGTQPSAVQTTQAALPASSTAIDCAYKIDPSAKIDDSALILKWSEMATSKAFDYSPATLDAQMLKLKDCFTEQGWTSFNEALQKSGNIEAIKAQNLTVSSQVDGTPQITETHDNQWKVSMPLHVVYQNDKEKVTQLLDINLTVGRKITGELGITQMVATPRANVTTPPKENPAPVAPPTAQPATPAPSESTAPTAAQPEQSPQAAPAVAPAPTEEKK